MLIPLATTLLLVLVCQSPAADARAAEQLARSGRSVEALGLFEQILVQHPGDLEARMWVARLQLRLGRTEAAEAGFRAVLAERPWDIDARIGLGAALTRRDAWQEALAVLLEVEETAGDNADFFGTVARAYRRSGDDRQAIEYYRRATALAPADPELAAGLESTARAYGHALGIEGFGEDGASEARSGSFVAIVRVAPTLRIAGTARMQRRAGSSDFLAGGGADWRIKRATTVGVHVVGGSGNTSLPNLDLTATGVYYIGDFEFGGSIRRLNFADVDVIAASPLLAWYLGRRSRLDARYTFSRSSFDVTGESSADHSVLLRETWRAWPRLDLSATYAYGIESFEDLTADRLQSLGATTVAAGVRIRVASLTWLAPTWEHQWRSNGTKMDRLTLSLVRSFP